MKGSVILKREPATKTSSRREYMESIVMGQKVVTDARETEAGQEMFGWAETIEAFPDHIYQEIKAQMMVLHLSKCEEVKNEIDQ